MGLMVTARSIGNVRVLTPVGDLDLCCVQRMLRDWGSILSKQVTRVVVDLRQVEFIDAYGVSILLHMHRWRRKQKFVVFVAPTGKVLDVLEMTGADAELHLTQSIDEAVEYE